MKIEYITINAGQRFDAVMPEIPTNSIINKTVTGCGATYAEINAPRHSVIIEPNVPVIEGKLKKHPQILGVFEGVTTEDIIDFLNTNYNDGYLKIMTTPESFPKVRSAMVQTHTDMHGEWFMLFDECERTIQDAGYRGSITLPMDDFFRCKQKAMVSATPIIPSDPRFEQQGFTMKILRPTYDHKPKMLLIHTNNTVGWVRTLMGQVKGKGHPLCIFLNSTDTIHCMICTYKIEKRCKVFCSYESVKKLRKRDFSRAYSSLEELDEINFFTSRFFSAVDIELPTTACVLIVTDLSFAAHTVIDPTTEAVQIVGRFRNGVEDAAHIFSTNKEMPCKSREEIATRLEECEAVYKQVLQIEASGAGCDTRAQALEGMDYKRFMNADGTRNWFMWDNAYDDERIKRYYTDAELVREEYAKAFHTNCAEHIYPLSDCDRLQRINPRLKMKDLFREIVRQLEILEQNRTWNEYYFLREEIQSQVPMMVDAYYALGAAEIERHNYNMNAISKQIQENESQQLLTSEKVCGEVYDRLKTGDKLPVCAVNRFMNDLIMRFGIPYRKKVTAKMIGIYFEYRDVRTNKQRFIELGKRII